MKKFVAGVLTGAVMLAGLVATPALAVECPVGSANQSANSYAECNLVKDESLWPTVSNIIKVITGILGLAAIIMVIMGGIQYTTSQGDPGKTKKAKDTIMYGIIGLVVALLAFSIVNFVLDSVFKGTGTGGSGDSSEVTKPAGGDGGGNVETTE